MPTSPASPATELTAAYARVSTLVQGEDVKTSLRTQIAACQDGAGYFHLAVDPACVAQEPYTGTVLERPALERLLGTMRQRGVRHLVMDKTDRVTRGGQLDAATLLSRLREEGVTLHLVQERLTIDNDNAVMMFLTFAFAAKLDNTNRTLNVQRNRQEAARSLGRYARGNRAPYGWQFAPYELDSHGHAINFRLVHDPDTFPVLVRMIRERQQGRGYWGIAKRLSDDGIPTPTVQAGQPRHAWVAGTDRAASAAAARGADTLVRPWQASTVQRILKNPLNAGLVTSFRQKRTEMPPDSRHPRRWHKAVRLPLSEQIALPSELVEEPPLTPAEYRWLVSREARARWAGGEPGQPGTGRTGSMGSRGGTLVNLDNLAHAATDAAWGQGVCGGGMLHHQPCGGTMRVKRATHHNQDGTSRHHVYYVCRTHDYRPQACVGLTVPVAGVDSLVWEGVRRVLLTPGRLAQLAEAQRQADLAGTGGGPGGLRYVQATRADLLQQRANLVDSIARQTDSFARAALEEKLAALRPLLEEAEQRIAEQQAVAANEAQRQAVVADAQAQIGRYAGVLAFVHLLPDVAQRVAVQSRILHALGFRATMARQADGRVHIVGELRLSAGRVSVPWFEPDVIQRALDRAADMGLAPETVQALLRDVAEQVVPQEPGAGPEAEGETTQWQSEQDGTRATGSCAGQPSVPPLEPVVERVETADGVLEVILMTTSSR